jgi:ligand-binding sensor domain-containing protein
VELPFYISIASCKNGDLFIGGTGGLSVYDFENDSVRHLSNDAVSFIFEDDRGILWIGAGAVREWTDQIRSIDRRRERFSNISDDSTSLASNRINSIAQDHKGVIWIGTAAGLCRFNETTGSLPLF